MARTYALDCLRVAIVHRRLLWCLCRGCGHVKVMDPRDMMKRLGQDDRFSDDMRFAELERWLKCVSCREKVCVVVPAAHDWDRT